MTDSENAVLIRSLPRRDRLAILSGLAIVTLLSWVYLVDMAIDMEGMMAATYAAQIKGWTVSYFIAMLLMWVIMMTGMMVPTAIPMALVYAAVARKAEKQGVSLVPTWTFVSGYVVMWGVFSLAATLAQWGLDEAALLSPMMVSTSPAFGAALLVVAGIYQLTPMKDACLRHCRAPAHFIAQSWRPGAWGAFRMGVEHGTYCIGCCWILMGLLFFGGVMSLAWIAGITLFVLLEKVLPLGKLGGLIAGGGMTLCGLVMFYFWLRA